MFVSLNNNNLEYNIQHYLILFTLNIQFIIYIKINFYY